MLKIARLTIVDRPISPGILLHIVSLGSGDLLVFLVIGPLNILVCSRHESSESRLEEIHCGFWARAQADQEETEAFL